MRTASVIAFPSETATPVSNSDLWVMCLEHAIPHLDPMYSVVRQRGKPARTIRLDPEVLLGRLDAPMNLVGLADAIKKITTKAVVEDLTGSAPVTVFASLLARVSSWFTPGVEP